LRALRDRPLALVHWNQGIDKPKWFQQDVSATAEEWMRLVETPARTKAGAVKHLVADSPEALRWLAQHAVLEIHAWHSRAQSLTQPDWVVFDLDPAEGRGIEDAVEVAEILRGMFDRLGLPSIPKTSGKRGLHVYVPLAKGHSYDDAQNFALDVGETVAKQLKSVTLERSRSRRDGRLYFDCLQNAYGKTVIAPYSLRGVAGAPVATPLRWSEVRPGLEPASFNLRTLPARLREVGDLFAPVLEQGVRLRRSRRCRGTRSPIARVIGSLRERRLHHPGISRRASHRRHLCHLGSAQAGLPQRRPELVQPRPGPARDRRPARRAPAHPPGHSARG
jgi:bifunctional non-homologous end joining protein LigD